MRSRNVVEVKHNISHLQSSLERHVRWMRSTAPITRAQTLARAQAQPPSPSTRATARRDTLEVGVGRRACAQKTSVVMEVSLL